MKSLRALMAVFVVLSGLSGTTLRADTYQIYDLGPANARGVPSGITSTGEVEIFGLGTCEGRLDQCYKVYSYGVLISSTITNPGLVFDNGVPCVPVPGASRGACNNGHEAFSGLFDLPGGREIRGIFTGPDLIADFLTSGAGDVFRINANGDFAWVEAVFEENYMAIDLTSRGIPEPGTLLLMLTGLAGVVGARRYPSGLR